MTPCLLAIDDETELLAIIARVGRELDYHVEVTTNPDTFMDLVRSENPSVVLLDLQMPGYDGMELLRFLHRQHSRAHIVLVSGVDQRVLATAHMVGESLALGMTKPLHKPFRVAELRMLLEQLRPASPRITAAMLRNALDRGEIELHYQPFIKLADQSLAGWEALARWRHTELGLIMPDSFIELTESAGLINALTERVIALATAQLGEWRQSPGLGYIAVNLSVQDAANPELPTMLARLCAQHTIPHERLRLEVTETAAMKESGDLAETLTRLRVQNFGIAIDDFGTGYSSISRLYALPFSELKIDRIFVSRMKTEAAAKTVVGAIIGLAHALDMQCVAEGVEDGETATLLAGLGCDLGQGYFWSEPLPSDAVAGWQPPGHTT